jgi:drug/metabolite transporter (DMT)-like permease
MSTPKVKSIWIILSIATLSLVWGSSFILVKKALVAYSPTQVGALRIFAAALFFIPIFIFRRKHIQKNHWIFLFLAGLTGNLLPSILFSIAGKHLPSAISGMLNAFTPLFTLIIGLTLFGQKFNPKQTIGLIVGLVGCLGLLLFGKDLQLDFNIHTLWVILATFLYGINLHIVQSKLSDLHPLTSTSGVFMLIGIPAFFTLVGNGFFEVKINSESTWPLLAGIGLGIGGSALAMVVFNQLIKWTDAIIASSVTYIIPIVALGWGLLDGESIYPIQVLFMLVLLAGVYMVNKAKN